MDEDSVLDRTRRQIQAFQQGSDSAVVETAHPAVVSVE